MNNRWKIQRKENRSKGFTLVELVVVIAVLSILAGAAAWGILGWRDWVTFKQQNEYAQTLFVAAQNQLTEYSESGELNFLQADLTDASGNYCHVFAKSMNGRGNLSVNNIDLLNGDGDAYDLTKLWPESNKVNSTQGKSQLYQGNICYLIGTAEKYEAYLNGSLNESNSQDVETRVLYDMLSSYVYDTSILRATICVEFTPEDGQVFAVLYSDKDTGFEYNRSNAAERGTVDISNRAENVRKKKMIGYYGVDTLSKATNNKTQKPVISNVKLNNEETLNLSWRLSNVTNALQEMTYDIMVKDKDSGLDQMKIVLDGTKVKNQQFGDPIPCDVTIYQYNDENVKTEIDYAGTDAFQFHAWVDAGAAQGLGSATSGVMHLVLDGADLSATSMAYLQDLNDGSDKLKETASFHRFGLDAENIYLTIKGTGTLYKTTASKESNVENAYFGTADISGAGSEKETVKYTLENARHLYNVRYLEDGTEEELRNAEQGILHKNAAITYSVSKDIDWKKFWADHSLYEDNDANKVFQQGSAAAFPSILKLSKNHVFTSTSANKVAVQNLKLSFDANTDLYASAFVRGLSVDKDGAANCLPTALFMVNYGDITEVSLDNVSVTGKNYAAAFCGMNGSSGTLSKLQVLNTDEKSEITGEQYVGGIVGKQADLSLAERIAYATAEDAAGEVEIQKTLDSLTNRAHVVGSRYVGGIIGEIQAYDKTYAVTKDGIEDSISVEVCVAMEGCQNYGQVEAAPFNGTDTTAETARYIGGITGYSCNNLPEQEDALVIRKCTSSPQYAQKTIDQMLKELSDNGQNSKLNGAYVGGIVGYNDGGQIEACSTKTEKKTAGYVFGYQYVGGIVGLNVGAASGTVAGGTLSNTGVNEANVIGASYVGGITGCNAAMEAPADEDAILIPEKTPTQEHVLQNWVNRGVIVATGNYVGGITGYNTGKILDCNTDIDPSAAADIISSVFVRGNYAGGIAGYNNGTMQSENNRKTLSSEAYLTGRNYVGGIVGYNDKDATVYDYELSGGYIKGTGDFVGGYAGLNASVNLLMDSNGERELQINTNPNEVSGRYCVGGTIGGNVVQLNQNIMTYFNTDNFLGKIKGSAFVGGFIGYNNCGAQAVEVEAIEGKLENSSNLKLVVNGLNQYTASSNYSFHINGEEGKTTSTKMDGISADIYVGGVIGYNAEGSKLYISNVINKTRVTATSAIGNEEEQSDRTDRNAYKYAYAGGIIGKVSKTVTIDSCKNQGVGEVIAPYATYHGAICEINEGVVKNCEVSSIGSNEMCYVGGIAGLNKKDGSISDSVFKKQTITGKNYVGGVTAENFGTIRNTDIQNGTVTAYGANVGGISGASYQNGEIYLKGQTVKIEVSSDGNAVGGLVGLNSGKIVSESAYRVDGMVSGFDLVGGVIGVNTGTDQIQNFNNTATVTAMQGSAGGIVGESSGGQIVDCINRGSVSSDGEEVNQTAKPLAGGIAAKNNGIIRSCGNDGEINAANGGCGGITAINEDAGKITGCSVMPNASSTGKWWQKLPFVKQSITFSAWHNAGGIAAENSGEISDSTVMNLNVTNTVKSDVSNIGAIAGSNSGTIDLPQEAVKDCSVATYSNGSNVGGVCGKNTGTISGNGNEIRVKKIGFEGKNGVYANMGGVAGENTGTIEQCAVTADIIGNMGESASGYGGIAGVNNHTISACSFDGSIKTNGSSDNIVNTGGIAGINQSEGDISACTVGRNKDTLITSGAENTSAAMGYVGGMIGWNYGRVTDSDNGKNSEAKVQVINYAGHTGGIVGYNMPGAVATGTSEDAVLSTGSNWSVISRKYSNDCGTGGIMGYSASGQNVMYAVNNASVATEVNADNTTAGGLVGRLENKENDSMEVRAFENNGTISSYLTGGMIGRLKYKGITLRDCTNYGAITPRSATARAAGILTSIYNLDDNATVIMDSCKNFGNISQGQYTAGMLGMIEADGGRKVPTVIISDCINEGVVNGTAPAGICSAGNLNVYIYRCRNYGTSKSAQFVGIMPTNTRMIEDCISVGNKKNLVKTTNSVVRDSYYLTGDGTNLKDDQIYLRSAQSVTYEGSSIATGTIANLYEINDARLGIKRATGNKEITFHFADTYSLKNFGLYWTTDGVTSNNVYRYTFTVSANNGTLYLDKNGEWSASAGDAYTFIAYGSKTRDTSYWSTDLDGTGISSIKISTTNVSRGTYDASGKFVLNNANMDTIYLNAMTASESEHLTATSAAVYAAQRKVDSAQAEYDAALQNYNDAADEYRKVGANITDWTVAATSKGTAWQINATNEVADQLLLRATQLGQSASWANRIVFTSSKANFPATITLRDPSGKGIRVAEFTIYWAGNNNDNSDARWYSYDVVYHYADGGSYTASFNQVQACSNRALSPVNSMGLVDCDKTVTSIDIKVKDAKNPSYICFWAADLKQVTTSTDADTVKENLDQAKAELTKAETKLQQAKDALSDSQYVTGSIKNDGAIGIRVQYIADDASTPGNIAISELTDQKTYDFKGLGENPELMIGGLWLDPKAAWLDYNYIFAKNLSGTTGKGNRQNVYEELEGDGTTESKIVQYYKDKNQDKPNEPTNVTIKNGMTALQITWTHTGSYFKDQLVYVVRDADGNEIANTFAEPIDIAYGIKRYDLPIDDAWRGGSIDVYVRAVNGAYQDAGYGADYYPGTPNAQANASAWISQQNAEIKKALPTPDITLELGGYDAEGYQNPEYYVAVLNNAEVYKGLNATINVNFTCAVTDKNGKNLAKTVVFNTSTGRSKAFDVTSSNVNQFVTAQATKVEDYADSTSKSVQVSLSGAAAFKSIVVVNANFKDFYGDQISNMYNQTLLTKQTTNTEVYMNNEFAISDYRFDGIENTDIDLVVSYGTSHVTKNNDVNSPAVSNLANLPQDLLSYNKVTVRSYPWQSQSFICQYGHEVILSADGGKTMSLENLKNHIQAQDLKDSQAGGKAIFVQKEDGTVALSDGYVLRLNADETYSVLYSAMLRTTQNGDLLYANQVKQKTYLIQDSTAEEQGSVSADTVYDKPINLKPEIGTELTEDPANNRYTFYWDSGVAPASGTDVRYELRLTGMKDGNAVLLNTVIVDQDSAWDADADSWKYTFTDPDGTWQYSAMRLQVTRLGSVDSSNGNATTVFPSVSAQDYALKLRFSTVTIPTLTLQRDAVSDAIENNSLEYMAEWNTIPEAEYASGDFAGYEVTIKRADTDPAGTRTYTEISEYQTELQRLKALYAGKGGTATEDEASGTYEYHWTDTYRGYRVEKTMEIRTEEDTEKPSYAISQSLTSVWFDPKPEAYAATECMPVDLNDYLRGEEIQISVRALAVTDAVTYQDGKGGVIREMTLPSRLEVPAIGSNTTVSMEPAYQSAQFMTFDAMNDQGITLKAEGTANLMRGKYQAAIAIYAERAEADTAKVEAGDDGANSWNQGAECTIFRKADAKTLSGNFEEGSIAIKASDLQTEDNADVRLSDYAGKWLKIALRAVSDSNISSWWSDEDDPGLSTNYMWLQIPRVQITTPELTQSKATLYYQVDSKAWDPNGENTANYVGMDQSSVQFEEQRYADYYQIQTVHASIEDDVVEGATIYYVDWIYAVKDGDGYNVFYETSDPTYEPDPKMLQGEEDVPYNEASETSYYLGRLDKDQKLQLPYDGTVDVVIGSASMKFDLTSYLGYTEDGFTYCLPDALKIDEDVVDGGRYKFTNQVTVQAKVFAEKQSANEDSQYSVWYYTDKEGSTALDTIEQAMTAEESGLEALTFTAMDTDAGMAERIAYRYGMSGKYWYVYKVVVKNAADEAVDTHYISAYGSGVAGSTIQNELRLYQALYQDYADGEHTITVQAAAIGFAGEGIGAWSEAVWTAALEKPATE